MQGQSKITSTRRLQNLLRWFCKRSIQKSVFSVQKFHRPGGSVWSARGKRYSARRRFFHV